MVSQTKLNKLYSPYRSFNKYVGGYVMKDVVVDEIVKGLNWKEKVIVKICRNTCMKLYRKGMIDCFNYYNKDGTF